MESTGEWIYSHSSVPDPVALGTGQQMTESGCDSVAFLAASLQVRHSRPWSVLQEKHRGGGNGD